MMNWTAASEMIVVTCIAWGILKKQENGKGPPVIVLFGVLIMWMIYRLSEYLSRPGETVWGVFLKIITAEDGAAIPPLFLVMIALMYFGQKHKAFSGRSAMKS